MEYKKDVHLLRGEVEVMKKELLQLSEDNETALAPVLKGNNEFFKEQKKIQEAENKAMQEQLTELKKDKARIEAQI